MYSTTDMYSKGIIEIILYLLCKITFMLSLFRFTFVNSIGSVHFLRTVFPGAHTRIHFLCHSVVNRTLIYIERKINEVIVL